MADVYFLNTFRLNKKLDRNRVADAWGNYQLSLAISVIALYNIHNIIQRYSAEYGRWPVWST